MTRGNNNTPSEAHGFLSETAESFKELLGLQKNYNNLLGDASKLLATGLDTVGGILEPFTMIQKSAIELAKSVGLAGKSIMSTATRTIEQNRKMQLSMSYNMSSQDMINMQTSIMSKLGRNVAIDQVGTIKRNAQGEVVNPNFDSDLENLIAATKVYDVSEVADIVAGFDRLGKSMKNAAKATGKLFQEAGEYGINLKDYTKNFVDNIGMAQTYNFQNGVNGLREMARKATEIRQDMGQIARFADKVGSVTGAVETAANLQVLGGSFAALSNPLAMLNESLTNVEGLQERFNKMTAGAAKYNSVTHEIEMDPVTRQLMKRAAESMGVSAENLIDQAYAQARRGEIQRQMDNVGNLSPEMQKMLPNIGQIDSETGVAGATIQGQFRSLAEIAGNTELQKALVEETRSESDDIKVIAKSVMGIEDLLEGRRSQMLNEAARNKIVPGAVAGTSTYDAAVDYLLNSFTNKAIEGAGKLDLSFQTLSEQFDILKQRVVAGLAIPFAENTPEKIGQAMGESFSNILGDGPIGQTISNFAASAMTELGNIAKKIDDYTSQYGWSPLVAFKTNEFTGVKGREPITGDTAATRPSLNMAARDVVLQANHMSLNDGQPMTFGPIERQAQITAASARYSNNDTYTEIIDGIKEFKGDIQVPIIAPPPEAIKGVDIAKNETSIPSIKVSEPRKFVEQQATPQQNQTVTGTYNLNLSGTLTMDVRGDSGKIGTVDLMKMIQNDEGFRRELARSLSEAVSRMNDTGLNKN